MQGEEVASSARKTLCHVLSVLLLPRMREVDLGCGKALLIKEGGEFHAVGHKCPHYGAPLVKGQSASYPRRQSKGIIVLAKERSVVIQLRCTGMRRCHTACSASSQHLLTKGGMSRKLGLHKTSGSTLLQVRFGGDPSLALLVTGMGLLCMALKNRTAQAPLNLALLELKVSWMV